MKWEAKQGGFSPWEMRIKRGLFLLHESCASCFCNLRDPWADSPVKCNVQECFMFSWMHSLPTSMTSDNLAFQNCSQQLAPKKTLCVAEIVCDFLMLPQAGGVPSSITVYWVSSLRKLSFLGGGRQFLAMTHGWKLPENSPSPFIGKGWVVNFPSGLLGLSLYSWLPKAML